MLLEIANSDKARSSKSVDTGLYDYGDAVMMMIMITLLIIMMVVIF